MKDKRNDTVVITGASAGLGRAIALEFAKHGARYTNVVGGCSNSTITGTN